MAVRTPATGSGAVTRDSEVWAARAVHAEIAEATGVVLPVRLWDGTGLGEKDAGYTIVVRFPWSLRAMLLPPGDLSAGEAYVEGAIDIEGDVIAAMAAGAGLTAAMTPAARLRLVAHLLRLPRPPRRAHRHRAHLRGRRHSRARDRAAIAYHYDLPQSFYEQFLDRRLVYSCAYYRDANEPLEDAQRRKLDVICRKLRLRPGQRLLDIGCGWGSLLAHAADRYGVRGVGVTLSATQAEAGRQRIAAAGLADRVRILQTDYRELDGRFDAVASVGMFEHVGPDHLGSYFAVAHRLTADGGLFLNHGIVTGDAAHVRTGAERTFVSSYVFPDGGLVPAWRAVRHLEAAGFELLDVEQLRPHYALTLRAWLARLEQHRGAALEAAGEARYRAWRAYTAASAVSFSSGALGVVQLLGSKGHPAPLGRDWMTPVT